jgi:hypothetical protein
VTQAFKVARAFGLAEGFCPANDPVSKDSRDPAVHETGTIAYAEQTELFGHYQRDFDLFFGRSMR